MVAELSDVWESWEHRGNKLQRICRAAQNAPLVAEAQRNPFIRAGELRAATNFLGKKLSLFRDLKKLVRGKSCDERPTNR
jgi:hypothetical protein